MVTIRGTAYECWILILTHILTLDLGEEMIIVEAIGEVQFNAKVLQSATYGPINKVMTAKVSLSLVMNQ